VIFVEVKIVGGRLVIEEDSQVDEWFGKIVLSPCVEETQG
jgi:hypothetical protein